MIYKPLQRIRLCRQDACVRQAHVRQLVHIENLAKDGVDRVGDFATMIGPAFHLLGGMQPSLTSEQLDSREDVRLA
jgi:hypothetical protein